MSPMVTTLYVLHYLLHLTFTNYCTLQTTEKSGLGLGAPCTNAGYGATAGWDAVSGVGSPNYPGLLSALA